MKVLHGVTANLPAILIATGAGLIIVPSAWLDVPVSKRQVGTAIAGLGVLLLYAGWYDRFESESETSEEDPVMQTPDRTPTSMDIVRRYVPGALFVIGLWLMWGQITRPYNSVGLVDIEGELPWGKQPMLGAAFMISAMGLWLALSHPRSPFSLTE